MTLHLKFSILPEHYSLLSDQNFTVSYYYY